MVLSVIAMSSVSGASSKSDPVNHSSGGIAIRGFDPVAYFTDSQALPGREQIECAFAGTVWRFRSEGNQAAFVADPEVYMPRFGGYDPIGVARGVPVPGNPRFWLIVDDRLYLFRSPEAREEFAREGDRAITIADRTWPSIQRTLAQ